MQRSVGVILLLFVLLGAGCSVSKDVVGHGPFQKRKYRPGWNVDLSGPRKLAAAENAVAVPPAQSGQRKNSPDHQPVPIVEDSAPIDASASTRPAMLGDAQPLHRQNPITALPEFDSAKPSATIPSVAPKDPMDSGQPRRWNRMALVSGIFLALSAAVLAISGGVPVLGYLMTFAFITGVIGLILAIKHNEKGKGIAIAAILFTAGVLALAVVGLNSAW